MRILKTWPVIGIVLLLALGGIGTLLARHEPLLGLSSLVQTEEKPNVVVERFYQLISEAQIRGGTMPLKEAYKLINGQEANVSEARFVQVVSKYPPGLLIKVINSRMEDKQAVVSIQYEMPSQFGNAYKVNTDVFLTLDKTTKAWKIDFTGETDGQTREALREGT